MHRIRNNVGDRWIIASCSLLSLYNYLHAHTNLDTIVLSHISELLYHRLRRLQHLRRSRFPRFLRS
jgi:hypothetical protein